MKLILESLALIPLIAFGSWSVGHHPFAVLTMFAGSALAGFIYVLWGTSSPKSNAVDESIDLVKVALKQGSVAYVQTKEVCAESSNAGVSLSRYRDTADR